MVINKGQSEFEALVDSINFQISSGGLKNGEIRFPKSMFEDLGKRVVVIPSRLFYSFSSAVDGYHKQRERSDLSAESFLISDNLNSIVDTQRFSSVHLIDIGGGDGVRGLRIAQSLRAQDLAVRYTNYDGSTIMLDKSKTLFEKNEISWNGVRGRFEDFKLNPIEETENELKLFLFLGNNYGNYASEDVISMFKHEQMRSEDALVIGIDTPCQETLDEFYLREIEKYHDDKMRMGLFSQLGFKRENLIDIIQVNREREQVEVYSLVSKKSSLSELKIEGNDLFLANIARRPSLDNLKKELSEVFTVVILKNANSVEKQLTLAVCKLKGTQ